MSDYYCIDLDVKNPEVMIYSHEDVLDDMKFFKLKSWQELSDYDRKVFDNEDKAHAYLERYMSVLNSLNNEEICLNRTLPAMLCKRRYIVQTLMGEKLQTYRHYNKNWKIGQLFNLHDQTFFLTVRLTNIMAITENDETSYKYDFEVKNIFTPHLLDKINRVWP